MSLSPTSKPRPTSGVGDFGCNASAVATSAAFSMEVTGFDAGTVGASPIGRSTRALFDATLIEPMTCAPDLAIEVR